MRKKNGFTLVELLVVMAIISILAAIAIPNVQQWIRKGRATRAVSEIKNIELAMTKLLSDGGRSSIKEFVDPVVFDKIVEDRHGSLPVDATINDWDPDAFDIAVELYTSTTYALLRVGREALVTANPQDSNLNFLLREDVVRQLGTSYMSDLGEDPWGNLYNIYPGPWSISNGEIPFRTYLPPADLELLPGDDATAVSGDDLSLGGTSNSTYVIVDPATGEEVDLIGVPANTKKDVYIWSNGENLISGQVRFYHPDVQAYNPADDINNYEGGQEPEFMGGGDDINNWDNLGSFMQFYN